MKVKIKKLVPEAHLPKYMSKDDGGMDLVAVSKIFDEHGNCVYGTGLSIDIPKGYIGLIFPRSSNSKKDLVLSNSVGVIDPGTDEEIFLRYKPSGYFASVPEDTSEGNISDTFDFICFGKEDIEDDDETSVYAIGDRIGQLIIIPRPNIEWEEVVDFSSSQTEYRSNHTGGDYQGTHLL